MKKLLRILAVAVLGVGLSGGLASAATGTNDTTGPGSDNKVVNSTTNKLRVHNNNRLSVRNNNPQVAKTGDARTSWNTTGGDATSGAAANDGMFTASATVDNSSALGGVGGTSEEHSGENTNTGPNSDNLVKNTTYNSTEVKNNNNLWVSNNNDQYAASGDAKVSGNTTGGSATSGDASNISTTDVTFNVTN